MRSALPTRLALIFSVSTLALSTAAQTNSLKPDLHSGGATPSLIRNRETTLVTLPGLHLTGTVVTVTGVCALKSYKVVSDTQITMSIEGRRQISDKEDGCFLKVSRGALSASTYIIVDLTEAEKADQSDHERATNQAQGEAYIANLGKGWVLHYADGSSETFTVQPADPGQLPEFQSSSGATAKIMTTRDNEFMIMSGECIRSGTLAAGQVKNGTSMGNCKPAGAWTAQQKNAQQKIAPQK